MSGLPSALFGRAALERAGGNRADVLVLGLLHEQDVGPVQVVGDLRRERAEVLVVGGLALRDVIEGRRDARTAGVPGEVAAVERVVAEVVEVLDVEVRDAVGAAAVEGSRRRVEGRVDPRREHRLLRGVDPVLVEREVDAADDRRAERVEDPGGRQQGEVVPRGRLDTERPEQDAIAVPVVDEPRLVVERVRVAEGAAGVGIAALCDGRSRRGRARPRCPRSRRRRPGRPSRGRRRGHARAYPLGAPSTGPRPRGRRAGSRRTPARQRRRRAWG